MDLCGSKSLIKINDDFCFNQQPEHTERVRRRKLMISEVMQLRKLALTSDLQCVSVHLGVLITQGRSIYIYISENFAISD